MLEIECKWRHLQASGHVGLFARLPALGGRHLQHGDRTLRLGLRDGRRHANGLGKRTHVAAAIIPPRRRSNEGGQNDQIQQQAHVDASEKG